jgi:DNA-binding XRE family transcriptional regulator
MQKENLVDKVCREFNINQKELADMLDLSPSTISMWRNEGIPKLAKIALECMIENKKLEEKVNILKQFKKLLESV